MFDAHTSSLLVVTFPKWGIFADVEPNAVQLSKVYGGQQVT